MRFHVIRDDQRLHLVLDHDAFAKDQPIVVADDRSRVQFTLENRTGRAHETGLSIAGLPAGEYAISVDGRSVTTVQGSAIDRIVQLAVAGESAQVVILRLRPDAL